MTAVWALTWLGQSAALAALTVAVVRLPACRSSATARHVAWSLGFFLCAALLAWPLWPVATTTAAIQFASDGAPSMPAAAALPLVVLPEPVITMSWWFGWVWVLGAAAGLALTGLDVWRVLRLKRRTVPLAPQEHARLEAKLSGRMPARAPRLAWCDLLDAPAVLGFSRPVIALPRAQMSSLSDDQARLVVLHELAHVRRGDDWWALAERIVLALTWVNPAVHCLHRELKLSREMACDAWVVRRTAAPVAYAKCLTEVAGLRTQARRLRLAAGATGRPGMLRRRVAGVLALNRRSSARAVAIGAWLAPVAVCVVAAGLLQLPPVVVVAPQPDASPAAADGVASPGMAGLAFAEVPAAAPAFVRPPLRAGGTTPSRRGARAALVPVRSDAAVGEPIQASAHRVVAVTQDAPAPHAPLASSPLPGTGAAGVLAADGVPGAFAPQAAPGGEWWRGPLAFGEATGGAAARAGRTTASFVTRFGSHVPQLLER